MKNTKATNKKAITSIVAATLALAIGTVGAFAATNASRVNPDNIKEVNGVNEDGTTRGIRMYVNDLDENGVPVRLTDEEKKEVHELLRFRDENGHIIMFDDGSPVSSLDENPSE